MNAPEKATSFDELLSGVDSDYARYFTLKISDLGAGAEDFDRLAEFCHASFYSIHAAAFAWLAVSAAQGTFATPVSVLKVFNFIRRLRGLPTYPIPNGSTLEVFQALMPLLELLDYRSKSDLRIRRILQTLDLHDCGSPSTGKWKGHTAHHAGFSLVEDVLQDILFATVGVEGIAAAQQRQVPRYDPKIIQQSHLPQLRRRLVKYRDFDLPELLRSIDLELARGFNIRDSLTQESIAKKTKILFLAADAAFDGAARLRLDKEARAIQTEIQASVYRSQVSFQSWWDAHPEDLSQQLLLQRPRIVQFAMHGGVGCIALTSDGPEEVAVSADAILQLFRVVSDQVALVVLSACYSSQLAAALIEHVDAAIGMAGEISDDAAVAFSRGLYRGVSAGRSLRDAFDLGMSELGLQYPSEMDLPKLFCRNGVDPVNLLLVEVEPSGNC